MWKKPLSDDPELIRLHDRWQFRQRMKSLFWKMAVIAFALGGIASTAEPRPNIKATWLSVVAVLLIGFSIALVMQMTAFRRLENYRWKLHTAAKMGAEASTAPKPS